MRCVRLWHSSVCVLPRADRTLFTPRTSGHIEPHGLAVSPVVLADLYLHSSVMPLVLHVSVSLGGCCSYPCPEVCAVSFAMCAVALLAGCAQPEVHGLLRSCVSRFPFRKDGKNLGTYKHLYWLRPQVCLDSSSGCQRHVPMGRIRAIQETCLQLPISVPPSDKLWPRPVLS